ncbi:ABC transporter permease [Viridibacillus arvi]|uniref:ABC transporter permease n=1 Tax=Viridibacillus arvi TaxID=263475 RepID=UPI00187B21DD|nr:ABC transporter permease [Viridibacillus sp. JNUCC-6]QOV10466.1 ABC transporter permease [Viridibacillus sp. JNUCC-6]
MKWIREKGGAIFLLLFILCCWELIVRLKEVPGWLLPAPTAIFSEAIKAIPTFSTDILSTTQLAVLGLTIGSLVGFIIAVSLHMMPKVQKLVYPLLILSQNIPIIVLAPLLIIWFGFGLLPKLIIIGLVCFFPIVVAALDGFKNTAPELKYYMEMAGASKSQLFWKLELPHSLPSLFSGLKISATYSVMGAVISEWLGAKKGIGVYMTLSQSSFRTDRVFVAIFTIMLLSVIVFGLLRVVEKIVIKGKLER